MPRADPQKTPARVANLRRASPKIGPTPPSAKGRGDATMARTHTAQALTTLVSIMTNPDAPATARVSAANAVLDRAWGKPRQDFEISSAGDSIAAIQRARERVHGQRLDSQAGEIDAQSSSGKG